MNSARRKELERAIALIEEAKSIVEYVCEEEQESFDNLPEGLQCTERGEAMEDNISDLEYIDFDEIIDSIQEVIER